MFNAILFILCAFIIVLMSACSNLTVVQPNPSIENPELRGARSQFGFQLGSYTGHEYTSTGDASRRPPVLNEAQLEQAETSFSAGLGYEFLERFRVSFDLDPLRALPQLKAQWQWLGPGSYEAKQGDWSSSIGFQLSSSNARKTGDQGGVLGPSGFPWEGEIRGTQSSLMLSVGHRVLDHLLFFVGGALGQMSVRTKISQQPSSDSSSQGGIYEVRDQGRGTTLGAGALVGKKWMGLIKFEQAKIRYDRAAEDEHISQLLLGLQF